MKKITILLALAAFSALTNASVELRIDPRIELVGVLEYFSLDSQSREEVFLSESNYFVEELRKYFAPYSNHSAIKKLRKLNNKGFSVLDFAKVLMYYDFPPKLGQMIPFERGFFLDLNLKAKNKKKLIEDLIESVRDFAKVSEFEKYLRLYTGDLEMKVEMVSQDIAKNEIPERLFNMFGLNFSEKKFMAIFCSWLKDEIHFYSPIFGYVVIIGPEISQKGNPTFRSARTMNKLIKGFASLLIDEIVDSNLNAVQSLGDLYTVLGDSAKSICKDWVCAFKHQWMMSIIPNVSDIKTPALIEIHKDFAQGFIFTPFLYFICNEPVSFGNADTINEFKARIIMPLTDFLGEFEGISYVQKKYEARLVDEIWQHAKAEAQNLSFDDVSYIVFHFLRGHLADASELINTKMELSAGNEMEEMLYRCLSAAFKAETGELLEAESMAKDCLISTDSDKVKAYAYFTLGIVAQNRGKVKKAEKMFIKASKLYPEISSLKEHIMNFKEGNGNDNKPKKAK